MMTARHPESEDVMSWIDGELAPERAEEIRAHVTACADCQAIAHDLESVKGHLMTWQIEPAPSSLRPKLADRSGTVIMTTPRRWTWQIPRWPYVLAVGMAVVVCVLLVNVQVRRAAPTRATTDESMTATSHLTVFDQPKPRGQGQQGEERESNRRLDSAEIDATSRKQPVTQSVTEPAATPTIPLLAKTATMQLVVANLDAAREALDRALAATRGSIGNLRIAGERPAPRTLVATLNVPAAEFDAALRAVRGLGRVQNETQASEDVTSQSIDLDARLSNARHTEQRLTELLANRTGKLSDVLEFEREAARVRGEIERMDAERKHLSTRVAMSTIELTMAEERRAEAAPATHSVGRDLTNAFLDGVRGAAELVLIAAAYVLLFAPTLLLLAVAVWPAALWFRRRRARARV
jgi:hypothetical protein